MILLYMCLLSLVRGLTLQAGKFHNRSNFHIVVELPHGIVNTTIRFVDCTTGCANGTNLFKTTLENVQVSGVSWSKVLVGGDLYNIEYDVPEDKQSLHIDMIVRPSDCNSSDCEVSEESYPGCRSGTILVQNGCINCPAGKYQEETSCKLCDIGKMSPPGSQICNDLPQRRIQIKSSMTFDGVSVEKVKNRRDLLVNAIANIANVTPANVVITDISQKVLPSDGRRLAGVRVVVKYFVIVPPEKDVEQVQESVGSLPQQEKVFTQIFTDILGISVTFGNVVTEHFGDFVKKSSGVMFLLIPVAVVSVVLFLLFVLSSRRKEQSQNAIIQPLIKHVEYKQIKF